MKKLLIRILLGVLVLLILVVVAIGVFLDSAIKTGVETVGPQITKVEVKLDAVNLSLLSGAGKIKGLLVGNPQGFKSPHAIKVGTASVAVSPGSLLAEKVVVKHIRLESPEITFEGGLGGNNLSKILDNVNGAAAQAEKPPEQQPTPSEKKAARKLQVDDFLISGAKVNIAIQGGGFASTVPIPDIHFTNLGQGPDGITVAELTQRVLDEITVAAVKAAGSAATDIGKGALNEATKDLDKSTKGITDLLKKKK